MGQDLPWKSIEVAAPSTTDPNCLPGRIDTILEPSRWSNKHGFVYIIESPAGRLIKIGKTINLQNRFRRLQKITRGTIRLLYYVPVMDGYDSEMRLHERFYRKRRIGEWFALNNEEMDYLLDLLRVYQHQTEIVIEHTGAQWVEG